MRPAHRRIDPRAKIAFAGVVVLLTIIIPRIEALAALGVLLVLVVAGGRGFRLRSWLSLLSPFKVLIPIILVLNAFFYGGGTADFDGLHQFDVLGERLPEHPLFRHADRVRIGAEVGDIRR